MRSFIGRPLSPARRRLLCAGAGASLLLLAPLLQAAEASARTAPVWLVLGDSLSAAFGITPSQGWVALLQKRLDERGYPARVVNASISGETTAGGLARLPALLDRHKPKVVLIELGGNDGLRALPVAQLREHLQKMVSLSKAAGATPVLFEMRLPSNYGEAYVGPFTASFAEVARKNGVPCTPFFLAPIATDPDAFQDDGIHPRAAVQGKLLDGVWPTLARIAGP